MNACYVSPAQVTLEVFALESALQWASSSRLAHLTSYVLHIRSCGVMSWSMSTPIGDTRPSTSTLASVIVAC